MHAVAIQTSNNSVEARLPCDPDFPSLGPGAHQLTYSDPWAQAPLAIVWTTLQWDCSLQLICVAALAVDGSQGPVISKLKLAVLQMRLLLPALQQIVTLFRYGSWPHTCRSEMV